MKTTLAVFVVMGIAYLYLLDDVGRFITTNLDRFRESLAKGDSEILRTPTDTLLEKYGSDLTEGELAYLKQQVVLFEDLLAK